MTDSDDERIASYLPHLTDALWHFREDPNWASQGALITACGAIWGDEWAMNELNNNPAWNIESEPEDVTISPVSFDGTSVRRMRRMT